MSSFEDLGETTDRLVEVVQSGELGEAMGEQVISLGVVEPIPAPVDPTGGVRATNETGEFGTI